MRTWIKFCGTTSLADAEASIAAGADALGFIFAPSKRHVSATQAREIIRHLPPETEKIGVFMDERMENILSIVDEAGLTGAQLHGDEPADELARLAQMGNGDKAFRLIKTVLVRNNFKDELQTGVKGVGPPNCILLDSGTGSGKTFVWRDALEFVTAATRHVIVAGGLTPENVGEAIEILSPWGVDVVSGVEKQAGEKDPRKLKAFVEAVRTAEKNHG
jgi:phosphoribosylanthranilate isomerase